MNQTTRKRITRIATLTLALGLCLAALAPAQRQGHGFSLPSNYGDTPQEARFRQALQWFMRGVVAESEGRFREARQYYERALAYDPESVKIRKSLVLTLIRLEDYDRARAEALKIDPHDSESALMLAELYHQAQMADSVMMFLEIAIKLDSTDVESRRRMIAYLENFGLDDSALVYRTEIARLTGDYGAFAALGAAHFRRGQYEKAAAAFSQSIAFNPPIEN
ncbi:MAG TPA: tetratricopeptide repeat protein, partial [candidate division Zixibacteria bacterium]|nr:tetratricopeptide repeat protein [candidate division Zixibacteria bacterium]